MQVAGWTAIGMVVTVSLFWIQETTGAFTWLGAHVLHGWGLVWCRMMRHTGLPVYTHQARRYR